MEIRPLPTIAGSLTGFVNVDLPVAPAGYVGTVTQVYVTVTDAPSGGTVTLSVRNATGGGGSGISVTIADGSKSGTATGALALTGTEALYLRISAESGASENLSGWVSLSAESDAIAAAVSLPKVIGSLTPWVGVDIKALPSGSSGTITKLYATVTDPPTGGTVAVRIGDAEDGNGSGITATIADGARSASATGTVTLDGGAAWMRITAESGAALNLSCWIETTVTTALAQLTTLARVKRFLGITATTHDTILSELITSVSDDFRSECGRDFTLVAYSDEPISGDGFTTSLWVRHYPIRPEPALVLEDAEGAVISSALYRVAQDEGILIGDAAWVRGENNYQATYLAGYDPIPGDIVEAATAQVAHVFAQSQPGGGRHGLTSVSQGASQDAQSFIPGAHAPQYARALRRYRRLM